MKRIFISGASRGIGLAIARRFVKEGWDTIICARGEEGLNKARAEMPGLITYRCDIGDKEAVKSLAQKIRNEHGPLEVLVNNGGIYIPGLVTDGTEADFETMMRVNVDSAYHFTRAFLPDMIAKGEGSIFNMCSIASLIPYPNSGAYNMSKFALLGFSKALRAETLDKGIRVVSLLPGTTQSSAWEGSGIPMDRLMPAEDLAEMVWTIQNLGPNAVVEEVLMRPQLGDL